jgi:hypothetical protein
MRHQTNSGKSATGSNTHACNFNFQHTHIENMFFPPEPLFGPWPIVIGAIPEILKSVPRPCCILLIFIGFDGSHGFATQEEYLNRGDVSRGHTRTIYNRSCNLIGNLNFAYTLIETKLFQSVVKL